MDRWRVIDSGAKKAPFLMHKDQLLLSELEAHSQPILHLYDWEKNNLTYGYFIKPFEYLNEKAVKEQGISIARRPTGGGILFHLSDLAFSVLIPAKHEGYSVNTLDNYAFINRMVIEAVKSALGSQIGLQLLEKSNCEGCSTSFCMAKSTVFDIMLNGKKIGGAAQRRTKNGYLHQGSLFLTPPLYDVMLSVLKAGDPIVEQMKRESAFLVESSESEELKLKLKNEIRSQFISS